MSSISLARTERVGQRMARWIQSLAAGEHPEQAEAWAMAQNWGSDSADVIEVLRAAVAAVPLTNLGANPVVADASMRVRRASIFASIALRVPDQSAPFTLTRPSSAAITASSAIPLQSLTAATAALVPTTIAAMLAASREVFRASPAAQAFADQIADALGAGLDERVFGTVVAGTTLSASATTTAALDVSLDDAIEAFADAGNDLSAARWVLPAETAARMSLLRGSGGAPAYPGLDNRAGGILASLPVSISRASSSSTSGSQILLIGASGIIMADDVVSIERSEIAALQMSSSPTISAITPTEAQLVSMWETNSVCIRGLLTTALASVPAAIVRIGAVSFP